MLRAQSCCFLGRDMLRAHGANSHSVFSITFSTPNSNSINCLPLPLLIDLVLGSESNSLGFALELRHRGPDWSGLHSHEDCYLAHQRLAIVDPTSGDQPLYNEDKTIVVAVNGEIYNHKELREKLKSHQFRTESDCEVIAHLYEEYGENFIDMLDGMFSFVLLDTRDKSFIAARDAIGITPLYMGWGLDEDS
ncbi:hypothetical protein MTR67_019484 [Solanum verrucosum]|uniref:Glutamine amidotransferase type-2 domain-containing protein n=1 Tax=Solanum verrucosum TaxID=315347 RepID=A0AAF0QLL4_SOLVR|nr:hypothetical protein MTR67_019484 [Solanum verrucosum]